MATSFMNYKYVYVFALISATLLFGFNVIFNVNSSHHYIRTVIPDYHASHLPHNDISSSLSTHTFHNTTNHIINAINNKLKQHHSNLTDCHLLFCDKYKFDAMISYYTTIASISHPVSWIELHDQLFCPLKYTSLTDSSSISFAGERLLKYIYVNQFKMECNDPSHKYLVYDTSGWYTGLGATTNGGLIKYFSRSLMSNRTFILVGSWEWSNTQHCKQLTDSGKDRHGFKCYFLPTSNCKYEDILSHIDVDNETQYRKSTGVPQDCNIGDFPDKPWCKTRVLYIKNNGAGWYPKNEDIDLWVHNIATNYDEAHSNLLFANYQQYKAVVISFLYRLQANVKEIIYNKIRNAFIKSFESYKVLNDVFDPFKTIAFPIRASDKCQDNLMGIHGEMECWTTLELSNLLYSVHVLKPSINSVIFTSEDMHFVDELMEQIHKDEEIEYKDGFRWNIIINHEDTKSSIGSARFRNQYYKGLEIDNKSDSDFEHDVMIGALSSLLLQTSNAKYIVHTKSSSWLNNLWNIGAQLSCESIFYSEQMEIKGFVSKTSADDDRTSFLRHRNRKYHDFNKFCFELKQHGLLNKKTKWKHILYPPDIWEQIHVLNLRPTQFKEKFGVDIFDYGWEHFCDRFTKPPFVLKDDIGI